MQRARRFAIVSPNASAASAAAPICNTVRRDSFMEKLRRTQPSYAKTRADTMEPGRHSPASLARAPFDKLRVTLL